MYLKRIDFENFKSFAGKLSVPFMEGYTAITGPNGSGKSNIIDGMMFVMGPKSAKVLRAKKLTDMIYKGEKGGSAANFTKVTLVFDNSDGMLSTLKDQAEVRFTRTVKLGGSEDKYYSKFYINDNPSTAEEFDTIFSKVRISADGYNMVQQGDVADITKMGNLDRRRIIDGISGIANFDNDIQRSTAKKNDALQNIETATVIINEIKAQLTQLEKDREAAKKYKETQEKLEMSKAQLTYKNLEIAEANLEQTRNNEVKLNEDIAKLNEKKAAAIEKIASLTSEYENLEKQIEARMGPEYRKIKTDIADLVLKKGIADDAIGRLTDENDELAEKMNGTKTSLTDEESKLASLTAAFNEKNSLVAEKKGKLKEAKDDVKKISDDMNNIGGESKALNRDFAKVEKELDDLSADISKVGADRATAEAQETAASEAVATAEQEIDSKGFELRDAEWNLKEYKDKVGPVADISAMKNRVVELEQEENKLIADQKDVKKAYDRAMEEYNRLAAEKKVSDNSNGNEAVRMILEMRDRGEIKGVYGTVAELATVDEEYETAIAIAAGARMNSIVVENDEIASEGIKILSRARAGRATFFPLNKMREGKPRAQPLLIQKNTLGFAMDIVKFDPKFRAVFWNVFADTLVVETLDKARSLMNGSRMVTLDGDLIDPNGAMTGGKNKTATKFKFGSAAQGRLEEAGRELKTITASLEDVTSRLNAVTEEKRKLINDIGKGGIADAEVQAKLAEMGASIKSIKETIEKQTKSLKEKTEALAVAKLAKEKYVKEYDALIQKQSELKQKKESIMKRLQEITPEEINQRMNAARELVDNLAAEINNLNEEILSIKNEKYQVDVNCNNFRDGIKECEDKIKANGDSIKDSKKQSDELGISLQSLRKIEADMESKNKELSDKKEKVATTKASTEAMRDKAIADIDTKNGVLSTTKALIITTMADVEKYKADVAQITIEVEQPLPSEEILKRRIKDAEETIKKIGAVNLRAIEEYDEKKERFDKLNDDVKTLNKEIDELDRFMADCAEKKKSRFMQTYEGIAISFKEIFREISGGGEAYISLENPEDPFEGGLILNAKPKSGKMLTLASLSGGEKSLTALAFIFAIQDCQPSPFYVFDEVDMFLDPINAEIVAKYIKKSSTSTQFLQITHKPNVLPISNHLIGVTKQSNGMSRVVMEPNIDDLISQDPEMQKEAA